MLLKRIYVSNFRSFDHSGQFIDLDKSVTILLGRNDSGKTNFIDAMEIILGSKSPYKTYLDTFEFYDPSKSISIEAELTDISDSYLYRVDLSDTQKNIVRNEKPERELVLKFNYPSHIEAPSATETPLATEDGEIEKTPKLAFYKVKNDGMSKPRIQKGVYDIRRRWINLIVVPAMRDVSDYLNTSKPYSALSWLLQELISDSDKNKDLKSVLESANKILNEIFLGTQDEMLKHAKGITPFDSIRLGLTRENNPEELSKNISLFLKLKDKEFELSQVGTGTQSALIIAVLEIYLSTRAKKAGNAHKLFVIEEPELFLHPHAIRRIAGLLRKLSEEPDFQVIISTHSPELALLGRPFNFFRFNLKNNKTEIEKINIPEVIAMKDKACRELSRANSEMLFAKAVILVEGETEQALLPILANNYTATGINKGDYNLNKHDISVVSMGGSSNFEFYYRYLSDLGIAPYFIFDGDISNETIDSLVKLYELKISPNTRPEKIKALDNAGVHILSVNEIEDLYPDKILAKIKSCTEAEVKSLIDEELYFDKRSLLNSSIRKMIKDKQDDILGKNMDIEESAIDKWLQDARKSIQQKGEGGEKRRGKAIARVFSDISKIRLGQMIGEWMVKDNLYPAELTGFIARVCEEAKS